MDWITTLFSESLSYSESVSIGYALMAVLFAYLGGILSSLTPCIYPMIPITLSIVGGLGPSRKSWRDAVFRAGSYIFGMSIVYAFLGVLAASSGKVLGSLTQRYEVYLALGVLMTLFALVMMDVIQLDLIGFMKERLSPKVHGLKRETQDRSLLGAFSLGASSGFIAAPCTTPILGSILVYIAKTQSIGFGLILMLSFSFGLGTLLLAIAGFADALRVLPKSGKWMEVLKVASGVLLLIFAEFLIFKAGHLKIL